MVRSAHSIARVAASKFRRSCLAAGLALAIGCACTAAASSARADDFVAEGADPAQATFPWSRETPFLTLGYSMALGAGDLNEFIDDVSFRGFDFGVFWPIYRSFFLGATFGYNGFYDEKPRSVYQLESGAVSARLYNYADAWPFAIAARYQFLEKESILRPFVGLRLGVEWLVTTTYVVDRAFEDSSTGFLVVPEAGLSFQLGRSVLALLSYQFSFSTASTDGGDSLSYNVLQLGLTLRL